jgi:hypothetical protein
MSEFSISFVVQGKRLGDLLTELVPFKVGNLDIRPVIQKGATGKKGGQPGWHIVASVVASSKKPIRPVDIIPALVTEGFSKSGIATHVAAAVKRKLIKRTSDGYVKGAESL